MVQYIATNQDGEQSLTVFGTDWQKPVAGTHPNYASLASYLLTTPQEEHDEEYVRGLVDPTVGIGRVLQEHFGDRVSFDMHHLRLDGREVHGTLAKVIKERMLAQDQDWVRFVKFLVNLDQNPSRRAQEATWGWVERHGLTITEDGRFLGYKAVEEDGLSKSAGPDNYVDGVLLNDGARCQVPHHIGSVISKRRADVDDTPGGGCSVGLHVGTLAYAQNFAPRLMTVAVNPRDVVSAGDRDLEWKIRVCEYEVISLADPKQFASTSYDVRPIEEIGATNADRMVAYVQAHPVKSVQHEWTRREQVEYDSLNAEGRTLYDGLRTRYAGLWDHDAAYLRAALETEDESVEPEGTFSEEAVTAADTAMSADPGAVFREEAQQPSSDLTLAENAKILPDLKADLNNRDLGHKPLARKWSHLTTEASVRRFRKATGVHLTTRTKVKDALS